MKTKSRTASGASIARVIVLARHASNDAFDDLPPSSPRMALRHPVLKPLPCRTKARKTSCSPHYASAGG